MATERDPGIRFGWRRKRPGQKKGGSPWLRVRLRRRRTHHNELLFDVLILPLDRWVLWGTYSTEDRAIEAMNEAVLIIETRETHNE